MARPTQPTLVEAPSAPLGATDATRRWAIARSDGRVRFPGVTRSEGEAAIELLRELDRVDWDDALIEVVLPVVLSDGAGPHLLAADGSLVLVLGEHPSIVGAHVAMGQPSPDHLIGVVDRVRDARVGAGSPAPASPRTTRFGARQPRRLRRRRPRAMVQPLGGGSGHRPGSSWSSQPVRPSETRTQ